MSHPLGLVIRNDASPLVKVYGGAFWVVQAPSGQQAHAWRTDKKAPWEVANLDAQGKPVTCAYLPAGSDTFEVVYQLRKLVGV